LSVDSFILNGDDPVTGVALREMVSPRRYSTIVFSNPADPRKSWALKERMVLLPMSES
jgi:hypothetical protein